MQQIPGQPGPTEIPLEALQQTMAHNQQMQAILQQRARAQMGQVLDAVGFTLAGARAGDTGCRADLKMFLERLEEVQACFTQGEDGSREWSGIEVARSVPSVVR